MAAWANAQAVFLCLLFFCTFWLLLSQVLLKLSKKYNHTYHEKE